MVRNQTELFKIILKVACKISPLKNREFKRCWSFKTTIYTISTDCATSWRWMFVSDCGMLLSNWI